MPQISFSDAEFASFRDALSQVGLAFADAIKPPPPPPPAPPAPPSLVTDVLKGDGVTDDSAALQMLLDKYLHVELPSGRNYLLDGTEIRVRDGGSLYSQRGATILCRNPKPHNIYVWLGSGTAFRRLNVVGMDPAVSGTGSLVCGFRSTSVFIEDVGVLGAGDDQSVVHAGHSNLALWGCSNVTINRLCNLDSTGGCYGLEIIGGSGIKIRDSMFHRNSADGIKIFGNADYGAPSAVQILNCQMNENGQVILQKIGKLITAQPTELLPNSRFLLNYATAGTLKLPPATAYPDGSVLVFTRVPGSPSVQFTDINGLSLTYTSDSLVCRFVARGGKWTQDWWTNGEGIDFTGSDLLIDGCLALGNEGSGIQVKPGPIVNNPANDIRIRASRASGGGNGFGVVNNSNGMVAICGVSLEQCVADGNDQSGFAFTTGMIRGVQMSDCIARSNGNFGLNMQQWCRDFQIDNVQLLGNGKGRSGQGYNWALLAGKRHRITKVTMSGVDPTDQKLVTDLDCNNAANARCRGLYALAKTSDGEVMEDVTVQALSHNHAAGINVSFQKDQATAGTQADFPNIRV